MFGSRPTGIRRMVGVRRPGRRLSGLFGDVFRERIVIFGRGRFGRRLIRSRRLRVRGLRLSRRLFLRLRRIGNGLTLALRLSRGRRTGRQREQRRSDDERKFEHRGFHKFRPCHGPNPVKGREVWGFSAVVSHISRKTSEIWGTAPPLNFFPYPQNLAKT
jgi:hypothetical protein